MNDTDNIFQRICEDRDTLSRAFRQIADFLIAEPREFITNPMRVLSEKIGVSEPTLIRFARHYGYQGLPDLRLSFAMSLATRGTDVAADMEPRLKDKEVVNRIAKQMIAAKAAELTAQDQSLLLDSGSTTQFLAENLVSAPAKTILTTSLNSVLILRNAEQHRLMMPGGIFRHGAMSLAGRMAEMNLADMTFDTAYIGADTLHPEHGISTYSEEEAHLNRAMIRASKRVVVLADASKFKGPALHRICDLSDVDIIVSDSTLSSQVRSAIEATSTELILAELSLPNLELEDTHE
ncbi:transcriptional regulator [Lentilitoribacter sp. Alg239-R112]|uniref:DeoR/GlpR family DNA-binding transcription regulator n=1 Tax=Lentilitoribacter sp. Alg239-R112 TaxID=2305987 RepID=UPI0013A6EA4C|nr:transcriptional regulator [Lentilitoribacter sp. Alg239-R112]